MTDRKIELRREDFTGWDRDEPFNFFGGVPGPESDDLHFHVADIGVGLDREAKEGDAAHRHKQEHQRQRHKSLVQGEGHDA